MVFIWLYLLHETPQIDSRLKNINFKLPFKRWRQLAAGPEYSHPQQKVQFFPKTGHYTVRSQYTYTRPGSSSKGSSSSSVRPRFHQDSATNAMLSRVKPAGPRKKEVYSRLLDDLIDHQRNDIDTLWKGYLNPNVANQRLRGTDDPLYDMSNPNTTTTKNAAANATTTSIHTLTTSMANGINLGESSLAAPMTTSSLLTADGVPSIPALRASIQKRKDHLMSRIDKSSSMKTKPHYPMNENLSSAASASDKNGEMVYDLLEQYDSVKIQLERQREEDALFTNTTAAAVRANNNINNNAIQQDNDHPTQPQPVTPSATKLPTTKHGTTTTSITPHRTIMPHLALQTRTDRYQTMKTMNAEMISFPFNSRAQDKEKLDKLDEIHAFLQQALSELPNPQHNDGGGGGGEYNKRRMQIFGVVFERIIQDFKVFGPVLAEIKAEYDKIIQAVRTEDDEVDSLRAKVRKLLSQNENRLQLDFEVKKEEEQDERSLRMRVWFNSCLLQRKRGKKLQEELKIMQSKKRGEEGNKELVYIILITPPLYFF